MDNDDLNEQEKKSLLKDMAKKGISKKIKAMPLKTKLIIIGVIFGVIFFMLIFVVLMTSVATLYFDWDFGEKSETDLTYVTSNSEDNYWWPIGGSEKQEKNGVEYATGTPTSVVITSGYGPREYYDENNILRKDYHYGIDIASSGGTDYVIAVAKGTVYEVGTGCPNDEGSKSICNSGMGNYIAIEHSGGNFTRYAHLLPDSITVSVGDIVNQGQIIGIMGNSGSSTGTHLDFKIFIGGYNATASNPVDYIFADNPRPVTVSGGTINSGNVTANNEMIAMLQSWEGTGPTEGDNYIVYDDGYGTLTVGHGVTLKYNSGKFKNRGININDLSAGSKIEKYIIDSIENEILEEKTDEVLKYISSNNLTLENYQKDALIIRLYNVGDLSGFANSYNTYGTTDELYTNFMSTPVTSNKKYSEGLARRRQAEWKLFSEGIYTYN